MKSKTKNKIMLTITAVWALLVAINEAGLVELMPLENEKLSDWIKFGVAFLITIGNMNIYNRTGNEDEDPPGITGNEDEEPPKP